MTTTMNNKIYYFLFGGWATRVYREYGFSELYKAVQMGSNDVFTVYKYDPTKDTPVKLLAAFDGYEAFAEITSGEFETLFLSDSGV